MIKSRYQVDGANIGSGTNPVNGYRCTSKITLVVDLEEVLVTSNIAFERFWASRENLFSRMNACSPDLSTSKRKPSRQILRDCHLSNMRDLPYSRDVIAIIADWQSNGGATALVTNYSQAIANEVAADLGLFDAVYGAVPAGPLQGSAKAKFILDKYGYQNYIFLGHSIHDLPVWKNASMAITVNANRLVREAVELSCENVRHLLRSPIKLAHYFHEMRPHQWAKNLLVFAPALAAHNLSASSLWFSTLAFIAFSLLASSAYIFNDLLDLSADRAHPHKCRRPLASGLIHIRHATLMLFCIAFSGVSLAAYCGWKFFSVILVYLSLSSLYSIWLKRLIIIDICVLSGLYTLRIISGVAITGISASVWLLAFSVFFFFMLAAAKRQAELANGLKHGLMRAKGRGYYTSDLPIIEIMAVSSGLMSVLVFALYINSDTVKHLYSAPEFLWGVCAVLLFWNNRLALLTHRQKMHDDPLVFVFRDITTHCCLAVVAIFILGATWL